MQVTIEVPENMAYELCHLLADKGGDYDKLAYEWWCRHEMKDAVYDRDIALSKFFYGLSKSVAKQTQAKIIKPVEVGDAAARPVP